MIRRTSLPPSPRTAAPRPPKRGNLLFTIISAENLSKRDKFVAPDLFATLSQFGKKLFTTPTIKKTLSPVWEATYELLDVSEGSSVVISVFNEKRLPAMLDPDCFLGECTVPVHLSYPCKIITT
ncbi:hypothetical protein RQP46_003686 [Phenoliferia psychrophenolica]